MIKIILTPDQCDILFPLFEKAGEGGRIGQSGSLVFQALRSNEGMAWAEGDFIPSPYADKIAAAIMEFYEALKKEILERHDARLKECRDTNITEEILRSQGKARELEQLVSFMELIENPPSKDGENDN